MKGKRKNKLIAILLVLMMAFSVIPANAFAAETDTPTSRAIADNADVIRLPITIRDANEDDILFQGTRLNGGNYNTAQMRTNIPTTIVEGVPQYNDASIKEIEQHIDTKAEIENISNPYLKAALLKAYNSTHNSTDWNSNEASNPSTTYLEDARSAYDAAKWMLNHLFDDGQYYSNDNLIQNPTNDAQNFYTKTYPHYESLVLLPDIYTITTGSEYNKVEYDFPCYSYKSKNAQTNFHTSSSNTTDDQIHNVSSGGSSYDKGGWFPLDNETLGFGELTQDNNWSTRHNYFTTTAGSGQFVYHAADELFFAFTGDDDVFLFINDRLVVNDGGVHGEEASWIFLEKKISDTTFNNRVYTTGIDDKNQTWAEYLGLQEGEIYNFNFFQMERNRSESNFAMYTNINVVDSSAVPQKKAYQNGQELIYGSFVTQNSEITYGFELTNNGESNITNLTFYDNLLGVNISKDSIVIGNNTCANLEYAIYSDTTPANYIKLNQQSTEEENFEVLKSVLAAGIAPGQTISIRGFKYNVGVPNEGATTKTIPNIVYTSALGKANNSDENKTITGYANMRVRTWDIANKSYVIDYGKKLVISNDDLFGTGENNELSILSKSYTVQEGNTSSTEGQTSTTIKFDDNVHDLALENNGIGTYGEMKLTGSSISDYGLTYTPKKFVNGIDGYILKIPVDTTTVIDKGNNDQTTKTGTNIMNKNVAIIPANNVYYEDDFMVSENQDKDSTVSIVYDGNWDTATSGEAALDPNKDDTSQDIANENYGWDSTYIDDTMFSDGSAHVADGSKQTNGLAKATFTFKGTGVDIYSMTNMTTGKVRGTIYKVTNDGTTETEVAKKILTVDNYAESYPKAEAENDLEGYYQIPTLFFDMGEYATYKVVIQVANGSVSGGTGRSIYYLDGIRVYNPLGTGVSDPVNLEPVAKEAYEVANENNTKVVTLRNVLLDSNNAVTNGAGEIYGPTYDADGKIVVDGVVFIDELPSHTPGDQNNAGNEIAEIGTYKDYGPKNEVYLAPGNAIAFTIKGDFAGKVMLGAKSPTGKTGILTVPEKDDTTNNGTATITTASAADQYWEIDPAVDSDGTRFVIIHNTGDAMMSLTKLRIQQPAKRTNAVLEVNQDTLRKAASFNNNAGTANAVNNNYSAPATIKEGTVTINNPAPVENEVVNESSWGEISASVETYLTKSN